MYEELVETLRRQCEVMDCGNCNTCVKLRAADAIETLQLSVEVLVRTIAEMTEERRWIPVTERLPEKRKWVLCRCEANIIEVLRWENNEWYHDPMHVYYPSFVTYWQPLPEPPKEELP